MSRTKVLSVVSVMVGALVGATIGPTCFFFLYVLALPLGIVVGGLVGGFWGWRTSISVVGFASLGVVLAELVFVLGERYLQLPMRTVTWIAAPAIGFLCLWLFPYLARKIWPDQRLRENAALVATLFFLFVPVLFVSLQPKDPVQRDADSFHVQNDFYLKCAAQAAAEGYHPTHDHPPKPAPHLLTLRTFPEICCPGVRPLKPNEAGMGVWPREANLGDWHVVMSFVPKAHYAETVVYYRGLLAGVTVKEKPFALSYPCTRISGTLRGEPATVIVADIPERGVNVGIF
ncbi:MAG: hypothetical protein QM758_11190 [Armatimonas sp.]